VGVSADVLVTFLGVEILRQNRVGIPLTDFMDAWRDAVPRGFTVDVALVKVCVARRSPSPAAASSPLS
jgi:hypothetical protein